MNYSLKDQNENSFVKITPKQQDDNLLFLQVDLNFTLRQSPKPVSVTFAVACKDIYSFWSPSLGSSRYLRPDWMHAGTKSRLASCLPLQQALSLDGTNRLTVTLSDAATPTQIIMGVCEETAEITCTVNFFTSLVAPLAKYHAVIRLDTAPTKYYDAVYSAVRWLESDCKYTPAPVPEHARLPMYSAWYSFHQNIDVPAIVEQCRLAKSYGMETLIVDDGWQTDDLNRGYAYCGDWEVAQKKVGDMKRFVDLVHQQGMKFMLWYAVPFVGIHSKAYERFQDMLLDGGEPGKQWFNLDPRYPEVRAYLVKCYLDAVKNWGLDGFKLDFIDSFSLKSSTPVYDERRDTVSLEEGIDKLLGEVCGELKKLNPDILIEFRQSYVGPAIRKYGNMLRAADCPNDAVKNRERITDLRFTSGKTAVHSDMLMWSASDSVQSAAVQVISTLFSVPQISVLLDQIPEDHQKMLKFYLDFWRANRDLLLDGEFFAQNPESLYTLAGSRKDSRLIAVAYCDVVWNTEEDFQKLTFINCHGKNSLCVRFPAAPGKCRVRVLDCMGECLEEEARTLGEGLCDFAVPHAGMLVVEKI